MTMKISISKDFQKALETIQKQWQKAHDSENVFRYKLDVKDKKILQGSMNFFCQLNPERATLRRLPQQIGPLDKPFDDSVFNFKKIAKAEYLLDVIFNGASYSFIINQSPLTKYHSLICPKLYSGLPQKLTQEAIYFALSFMKSIESTDFIIGYNSPGALASVNHLHLHLMQIEQKLYIETVELKEINANFFRPQNCLFDEAFCYVIKQEMELQKSAEDIYEFIKFLCKESIPHNLSIIKLQDHVIRVFIFIRENPCVVKDYTKINIAFCEFSGYFPVGDKILYESLNEEFLIKKIKLETGNCFDKVKAYVETLPIAKS
ncbi:GDP-D-glucose phosphorylase 1 [Condylostylus longicornis]|uniref:GDP-D-glucose phosphorylase 1 n=1 Tax=Condylostylus longicornis TaxID=2530218 RepID=UPI00244E222F|nr:GDP-D-glucose phosphorylase 1 [Condylostylus longicornis]